MVVVIRLYTGHRVFAWELSCICFGQFIIWLDFFTAQLIGWFVSFYFGFLNLPTTHPFLCIVTRGGDYLASRSCGSRGTHHFIGCGATAHYLHFSFQIKLICIDLQGVVIRRSNASRYFGKHQPYNPLLGKRMLPENFPNWFPVLQAKQSASNIHIFFSIFKFAQISRDDSSEFIHWILH